MSKFIKNGDKLFIRPEGMEYDIKNNSVYRLKYDNFMDSSYLIEENNFVLPEIIFDSSDDKKFINKIITSFNKSYNKTTGVMLSGLKGAGKTLMAKRIALESGVPVIIVDPTYNTGDIETFFNKLNIECCVILDEVEKNFNPRYLLGFLDGVQTSVKKLVICTCNDLSDVSRYMIDRCSRIRYHRSFKGLSKEVINNIYKRLLEDESKVQSATEYTYNNFNVKSFDNVIVFADEINDSNTNDYNEIVKDLNITVKDTNYQVSDNKNQADRLEEFINKLHNEADFLDLEEVVNQFHNENALPE